MSITLSPPSSLPHASLQEPRMTFLRQVTLCRRRHRSRQLSVVAAIIQNAATWTAVPLAESLFHITVDVSDSPELAASHVGAGQYLQLWLPGARKPSFLAVVSPLSLAVEKGVFVFLVKSTAESTAELLSGLGKGDLIDLTQVMGRSFDVDQTSPLKEYSTVLIFATGSGIR